jgi:acyl carrier protein
MRDEIRAFIVKSLLEMDLGLDIGEIEDDTVLGTEGLDLESLVMADLAIRVEDRFGVQFDNDEAEQLALMTVGEFADTVAARVGQGSAAEPSHP